MKTKNKTLNLFKWHNIRKQKYGLLTSIFYGIGTALAGFSTAFLILANATFRINPGIKTKAFINIAGGLWVTLIREFIFLIFFILVYGLRNPKLFSNLKYTFTRGGRIIIYSVISNFLGDVAGVVGIVLLLGNTSLSSVFETSFIVLTFFATIFVFKHKFNLKTFLGVLCITIFMFGIFFVNYDKSSTKISAIVGLFLMFLANVGYLIKNILTEYVYKNRLLDTKTTQLFATFYAFIIGLIIVPLFFLILQPLLLGHVNAMPWQLLPHLLTSNHSGIILVGIGASVFLLAGRNCQYANTMISGAAISNIFYQGKLIVSTVFSVVIFAIWSAFGKGSLWPYLDKSGHSQTFSGLIDKFNLDNWIYWVLLFLLFAAIVYTVLSGQKKFEISTHEYRIKNKVKIKKEFADDEYEYETYKNKTLDEHRERKISRRAERKTTPKPS